MGNFMLVLLMLVGMFLMIVVLLQRGRGGGLAGAFGGLGGQSAFGTKAGDVFTLITIGTAFVWVVLACLTGWRLRVEAGGYYADRAGPAAAAPETPAEKKAEKGVGEEQPASKEEPAADSKEGPELTPAAESKYDAKAKKADATESAPKTDEPAPKEPASKEPEKAEPAKTDAAPKPSTEESKPAEPKAEPKPDEPKKE